MRKYKKQDIKNDITPQLKEAIKNQRISVFVDAGNLYHTTNRAGIKLDFTQIARWFKQNTTNQVDLRFYTAYDPENSKQINFLANLNKVGFHVVKKPIKEYGKMIKGNMDIELAVDAISYQDQYDTLVLISGDGDFTYLVNALERNYKKSIVVSVGGYTSFELHVVADSYFFLNRISEVWQTKQAESNTKSEPNEIILSTDDFEDAYFDRSKMTTSYRNKPKKKNE